MNGLIMTNLSRYLFVFLSLSACSPQMTGDSIDLVVNGDYIVTMDVAGTIIENGAVAIDNGVIIAVGSAAEIGASYEASENLAATNRVVMPGLVNGHSHAAMSIFRGIADDLALKEWLNDYMFPLEVEFVDAEFVRLGTELACWEMIRGGTTTFVDMYYFPDTISEVASDFRAAKASSPVLAIVT